MHAVTPNESEIQRTLAGVLWGAYLMRVAHFYKEIASQKLAINSERYQKCEIVVEFQLEEAEVCDIPAFLQAMSKNGTVPAQPCIGDV